MWITNPSCDEENFVANFLNGDQDTLVAQNAESMLPLPYQRYWHASFYDPSIPSVCVNFDNVTDQYGDSCTDYYDANPTTCSYYDTSDFTSSSLCCACGGGETLSGSRHVDKIAGHEFVTTQAQLESMFDYPPSNADQYAQPVLSIKQKLSNEVPVPDAGMRFVNVDELMLDENKLTKTGLN